MHVLQMATPRYSPPYFSIVTWSQLRYERAHSWNRDQCRIPGAFASGYATVLEMALVSSRCNLLPQSHCHSEFYVPSVPLSRTDSRQIVYNILFTTKLATLASSDGHVEPIGLAYGMQNGLLLSVAPTMLLLDLMLVMDMFFFSLQMALIVLTIIVFVMGNFASIWQLCFLAACSSTQVASVICSPHRATAVCAWTRTGKLRG